MGNNKYIKIYNGFENINKEYFFKDFLSKCYENGLLDDVELNKIYNDRLKLLKIQLKYYTKDETSSVMVEVAEKILKGIDYTLGIYLKSLKNIDLMIKELKGFTLEEILKKGNDLIKEKVKVNKELLVYIQNNKINVDNYSYNDTIDYGIPLFFKEYDYFFTPHEAAGSIDYQLCIDDMSYVGIEYIENYLNILQLENEFCHKFNIEEVKELLKGYDVNNNLLLINIFELVLTNAIGLMICDKGLSTLNINNKDRDYIKEKLCNLQLCNLINELKKYVIILYNELYTRNVGAKEYIDKAILKIAPIIKNAIELDKLENVFISFVGEDNDLITYVDKEKMSNSRFRNVTEKIRGCSSIEDKIKLIKNNIESLEDLIDMLDSECLFDDEYEKYFKSLSQFEIILIFKYIQDLSLDNIYSKDWYLSFNQYISQLDIKEQVNIKMISENIILS